MSIKNKCGLWGGISTIFKIITKLYNKRHKDDTRGTSLTCYSMHFIMIIKNMYWFMGGDLDHFQDNL